VDGTACRSKTSRTGFGGRRLALLIPATERPVWRPIVAALQDERGVAVDLVERPNATDLRENLYTAALLAGDDSFDLAYTDVTWTPKFVAAGWLLPLDDAFRREELEALLPAALEAGRYQCMSILAFVSDQHSIRRILDHLGLTALDPERTPPPREILRVAEHGEGWRVPRSCD
jgi:hypothetical protein